MEQVIVDGLYQHKGKLVGYLHSVVDEFMTDEPRSTVIICPGGGYERFAAHEADPVAMRFFAEGYNAFVLYYSVFDTTNPESKPLGLQPVLELGKAIMTLRENQQKWRINPNEIVVCGFSAGGHLAASGGVLADKEEVKQQLGVSSGENKPNAMVLCYPVLIDGEFAHKGSFYHLRGSDENPVFSLEKQVNESTPPAFIWHTVDDESVPVENSLLFALELSKYNIDYEAHFYNKGAHGISLATKGVGKENPQCESWFPLCLDWLYGIFNKSENR